VYDDLTVPVKVPNDTGQERVERIPAWQYHWQCSQTALQGCTTCAIILSSEPGNADTGFVQKHVRVIADRFLGSEETESVAKRRGRVDSSDEAIIEERIAWEDRLLQFAEQLLAQGTPDEQFEKSLFAVGERLERLLCPIHVEGALLQADPYVATTPVRRAEGLKSGGTRPNQLSFNSTGIAPVNPGDLPPDSEAVNELVANILVLQNCFSSHPSGGFDISFIQRRLKRVLEDESSAVDVVEVIAEKIRSQLLERVADLLADPSAALRPRWNKDTGELRIGDNLVRELVKRAENCVAVLDAFEEEGWPASIDDPLSEGKNVQRLNNTVRSLNQNAVGIRFSAGGDGESVMWKIDPSPSS